MQYQGGKSKIAKELANIFATYGKVNYYEPFLGGGSVAARVIETGAFENHCLSDAHEDLILMYQAMQRGEWNPPFDISKEEYDSIRKSEPSPLRTFVGFSCSFGGKFFGGYAKASKGTNYARGSANQLNKKMKYLKTAHIDLKSYKDLNILPNSLIYCDPPYANTVGYAKTDAFDHNHFWNIVRHWSQLPGVVVLVSEYAAPSDFKSVWSKERHVDIAGGINVNSKKKRAVEHLFQYAP